MLQKPAVSPASLSSSEGAYSIQWVSECLSGEILMGVQYFRLVCSYPASSEYLKAGEGRGDMANFSPALDVFNWKLNNQFYPHFFS